MFTPQPLRGVGPSGPEAATRNAQPKRHQLPATSGQRQETRFQ